jgi:hypothetical protein
MRTFRFLELVQTLIVRRDAPIVAIDLLYQLARAERQPKDKT